MNYIFLSITILGTVIGQIILKIGADTLYFPKNISWEQIFKLCWKNLTNLYFVGALFFALVAALSWSLVIQRMKLSVAYPFMSLSYVLIFLSSYFLFKEQVQWQQFIGIVLIFLGLAFIGNK